MASKDMVEKLRLAIGILGNAASLLLYAAPILTFVGVIRKKSTEGFSCVPYIVAFSNCFLYTWYAMPVVSCGWENFTVATVNGVGILLEFSFVIIYFYFASAKGKKKVTMLGIPAFTVSCLIVVLSAFAFHNHHNRKALVGSVGVVASIGMYGSPLVAVKRVIQTRSVEFMPFYLSLFSFLASSLWLVYGLLSQDLFLASPCFIGSPLGLVQLLVYCKYRKSKTTEQPQKWDLEINNKNANEEKPIPCPTSNEGKNDDKIKLQLAVNTDHAKNGNY